MGQHFLIKSSLLVYETVKITINGQAGVCGKGLLGLDRCLLRRWVVLKERFDRGCVEHLSQQFVPKWENSNGEREFVTACAAALLVELVGMVRSPLRAEWPKVDSMGNSRREWVIWNMPIRSPRIRRCTRENRRNCLRHYRQL